MKFGFSSSLGFKFGVLNRDPGALRLALATFLLTCLSGLWSGQALAAVITVTPERDPVHMDESFSLVFSSEEGVDDDPDFRPLQENFEILGQNEGNQVSIVNGKMSRKHEWTLTLMPKRTGAVAIPPIAFGKDRSPPARITVLDAGAGAPAPGEDDEIRVEVDAEPKNPYVQAQVIYTVRVLMRVNLAAADLSEPAPADALVERLGEDHRYTGSRGGREYAIVERRYALFPQKSGLLRIEPIRLDARVEVGGNSFFARPTRAVRVRSASLDLKVRPIPAEFTGKHWLPAADLKLEDIWPKSPPQVKAGEPLTRTLKLSAQGATVGVLPELGADPQFDPSIKQYPDQPSLTEEKHPTAGILAVRQEKSALIPGKPGEFKLPALEIPWWNTKTEKMEVARVPERILQVEPSGEAASRYAAPAPAPQLARSSRQAPGVETPVAENIWFWLALFLGTGWLGTGLAWWKSLRKPASPASTPQRREKNHGERHARQALQRACFRHDANAAHKALLHWARYRWDAPHLASLADVADLGGGALAEEIGSLKRALYGNGGIDWRGDGLWLAVQSANGGKEEAGGEQPGLEPLYR